MRELHEPWCRGLIEGQLRYARAPHVPLDRDYLRIPLAELATRLAELPGGGPGSALVDRYRGAFTAPTPEGGEAEFAWVSELGGFHVSGPCDVSEIVRRFGKGDYHITAYGFNLPGLRWEVIVKGVSAAM